MGKKETAKLRQQGRDMFVELGRSQKDIAKVLGVTEATVSRWVNDPKENWKTARMAKMTSNENMLSQSKQAVANLGDIMLELQMRRAECVAKGDKMGIAECDRSILSIADAISKTGASVAKFEKKNTVSFVAYLNVMESIFKALMTEDEKLHKLTIDFQERHAREMAKKLG